MNSKLFKTFMTNLIGVIRLFYGEGKICPSVIFCSKTQLWYASFAALKSEYEEDPKGKAYLKKAVMKIGKILGDKIRPYHCEVPNSCACIFIDHMYGKHGEVQHYKLSITVDYKGELIPEGFNKDSLTDEQKESLCNKVKEEFPDRHLYIDLNTQGCIRIIDTEICPALAK